MEKKILKFFIYLRLQNRYVKILPVPFLTKSENVFLKADPSDEPDAYGLGSKVIVTSCNGYCETKSFNEVAFGWNNSAHTNLREFIALVSDALANALTSLRSGVGYSKNHPIYKARDDKEAAALNEYWKKVKDSDGDDDLAIASKNILDELEGITPGASQNVINLSDPATSDKLQYVDRVVDSMIRRYFSLYGQSVQGGNKLAQESVDEVNGYTTMIPSSLQDLAILSSTLSAGPDPPSALSSTSLILK